jgi:RNA polymerase sigma-70 factor, ECF subfamily
MREWSRGDDAVLERLTPLLYDELRRLAASLLRRERPGHTLQATALVHEAYLHLLSVTGVEFQNRAHFFGIAAHLMRQILVQHARSRNAQKRGGGVHKLSLDETAIASDENLEEIILLDRALSELAELDERKSRIIELRYFGGLSAEETAGTLNISVATVGRESRLAHAWLFRRINGDEPSS